eukprot:TRINITY_DN10854_c0_g1_i2.p1 TRINITY_DN10854_c0_g1~~TRINITY_DN10854_c0_g1_i2.p1  ORF type:complete len:341 (-),score=80.83 TRINITY_DN10854_c0_g1_i2:13-1035(-)
MRAGLWSLPLDVLRCIVLLVDYRERNYLFMTSKAFYGIHKKHCKALPQPTLVIKTRTRTISEQNIPFMDFQLQHPPEGVLFDHFEIFVSTWMDTLILPFVDVLKWSNHSNFCGKWAEMGLVSTNAYGSTLKRGVKSGKKVKGNIRIPAITEQFYCWNGEAKILMSDGSTKSIEELEIGDVLQGASGNPTVVKRIKETVIQGIYKVVDMGDFLITRGHPVLVDGEWYRPDEVYPVCESYVDVLYNLYAEPEHFVVVGRERVVCSSLGGYCPRLAELDPVTDVLYGRGYGSKEAEEYRWLLGLKERIPDSQVHPKQPATYEDLYPGREHIVLLGRSTPTNTQ